MVAVGLRHRPDDRVRDGHLRSAGVAAGQLGIDREQAALEAGRRLVISSDFHKAYQSLACIDGVTRCGAGPIRRYFLRAGAAHPEALGDWCDAWTERIAVLYRAHTPGGHQPGTEPTPMPPPLAARLHRHRRAPHPAGQRRRQGPAAPGRRQGHRHAQQRMGRAGPPPGPAAAAAGQQHRRARPAHPGDRPQNSTAPAPNGPPTWPLMYGPSPPPPPGTTSSPRPATGYLQACAEHGGTAPAEPAWTRSCPGPPKDAPAVVPPVTSPRVPAQPPPARKAPSSRHMTPRVIAAAGANGRPASSARGRRRRFLVDRLAAGTHIRAGRPGSAAMAQPPALPRSQTRPGPPSGHVQPLGRSGQPPLPDRLQR